MRLIRSFLIITAAALLTAPAIAQTPAERMRACEPASPGAPLVGTVTDAHTGLPLPHAAVMAGEHGITFADSVGCYAVSLDDEHAGGRWRVRVSRHRFQDADTSIESTPGRGDTVHVALRPVAPPCCRLDGEWRMRLTLDSDPGKGLKPRADQAEGTMVFSARLPAPEWARRWEDPQVEQGRFDVDLATFFGGPYAQDISTTVYGPATGDFFQQALGEVLAHDSVMIVMIPGMSHGGLSLAGTLRGDTVHGKWVQNSYGEGARGRFTMHRVPPSPAGDSLVARGVRALDEMRRAMVGAERARKGRVGYLRLRVFDESTGGYVPVDFAASGHDDNPGGGTYSASYASGADGWGEEHAFEPGSYDLFVYRYRCKGEERFADEDHVENRVERITVTIQSGQRVDKDVRLDLCSIKYEDRGTEVAPVVPVPG